jgi:hypothetical protein
MNKKPRGSIVIKCLVSLAIFTCGVGYFALGVDIYQSIRKSKENKAPEEENFYHAELNGHSYIHSPDCPCGAY